MLKYEQKRNFSQPLNYFQLGSTIWPPMCISWWFPSFGFFSRNFSENSRIYVGYAFLSENFRKTVVYVLLSENSSLAICGMRPFCQKLLTPSEGYVLFVRKLVDLIYPLAGRKPLTPFCQKLITNICGLRPLLHFGSAKIQTNSSSNLGNMFIEFWMFDLYKKVYFRKIVGYAPFCQKTADLYEYSMVDYIIFLSSSTHDT